MTADEYRKLHCSPVVDSKTPSTSKVTTKPTSNRKGNPKSGAVASAKNTVQSVLASSGTEEYDKDFESVCADLATRDFQHAAYGNQFASFRHERTKVRILVIRLPEGFAEMLVKPVVDGFSIKCKIQPKQDPQPL